MKKKFVNVFVAALILSFVIQPSSAIAISDSRVTEPIAEVLSDPLIQSEPLVPVTPEKPETLETGFPPEPFVPAHRYDSEKSYAETHLDPDLPSEVRAHLLERAESVGKAEYTPPTPEVIAQTQAQVESFSCAYVTDVPLIECEALVALYNNTNGAGWCNVNSGWLIGTTVGSWTKLTVTNGHVTEILLYNSCLSGTLPPQLGDLVFLEKLFMFNGGLTGNIPQEITKLTNLKHFSLGDNLYSGPLPAFLGTLPSLVSLYLNDNGFSGSIPPEFGELSTLEQLNISENSLSGSIPVELSKLSKLVVLHLDTNRLSGIIPTQLGDLRLLQELWLFRNGLTGNIPASLGYLSELKQLYLENNNLSGTLPAELGNLSKLGWLKIYNNQLIDSIPLTWINMTQLNTFQFYGTSLCEPPTTDFLAWKATVYSWTGTGIVCEAVDAPSWLLMYYMAGDNDLDGEILSEARSIIDSRQPNVDIAIFLDSTSQNTSYQFYQQGSEVEYINNGNLNSGDGPTLSAFMLWAKAKSNAPQYALIIADHGHGLSGVAWDYRANYNYLTLNKELRSALVAAGPVDVLYGHACLTASMEFMWELRGLTDYYVASESVSFTTHHDYIQVIGQDTSAEGLAISMANSYYSYWKNRNTASSISIVEMAYLDEIFLATNDLALVVRNAPIAVKIDLWNLLDYTVLQRFHERERNENDPPVIDNYDRLADLFHFASLANYFGNISPAAQKLLDLQFDFLIYNRAWSNDTWNHDNARGVSIALPRSPMSFYNGEWLDFATGADWTFINNSTVQSSIQVDGYNWGPMVSDLIAHNNPEGEDSPLPPDPLPLLVRYEIFLPILTR